MTLRLRYYLAVLPLMLGLGIASAAVLIHLVRSETAWGMQQHAEGVASSIAEFLPVLETASDQRRQQLLADIVARLGSAALTVHHWPLDGTAPKLQYAAEGMTLPPPPTADALDMLQERGAAWRHVRSGDQPEASRTYGYAFVLDADGAPQALVAMAERDDSLTQSLQDLQGRLLWIAAVLFLLGCLIAEWLTRSVQRELGTLIRAATALEAGGRASAWAPGRIQEVNDLGGTLQTMGSLLEDGIKRIRLGFFEAETIPTRHAMAQQIQRRQLQRLAAQPQPAAVAWRALGLPPPEHFLAWRVEDAGWTAVIGSLSRDARVLDPLETALFAQALGGHLLGLNAPEWNTAVAGGLLSDVVVQRIGAHAGVNTVQVFGAAGKEAAASTVGDPDTGKRRLFGTLDAEAMQVARMYMAQTSDRPLEQVVAELESLLGERYSGFLWVFETGSGS